MFDVAETIENVMSLYEYISEEKKIAVSCQVSHPTLLYADKIRINQVLANLLDNGLKYGQEGGFVHISVQTTKDMVSIIFEDNGMGISANEIGRIWERLYRGDRSRTQQGLGLGLNYVRAVVEAHGGVVSVSSTLGLGARFQVDLHRDINMSLPEV